MKKILFSFLVSLIILFYLSNPQSVSMSYKKLSTHNKKAEGQEVQTINFNEAVWAGQSLQYFIYKHSDIESSASAKKT
ncbi:hypothetical protein [Spiroplasma tabanidicola]|uniref:Uncharacterized protein n=1 Tax=Spiroplasma tabanidicola TaxID=324079 RepID=A0A6I6CA85_9MOLU|nr:hypothetical protein [Spiroplasma tabanidicola]QGS52456.1 hypothetical protein STABA_v1c11090 [Spiroplasma tabanidicola]